MTSRIPVSVPDLEGNEEEYLLDALRSSWISSTGSYVTRFEAEFAELCGVRHCLSVSNGTVALHLALEILGVRPGDEVIVPALTYIAAANAVRYVGADVVLVDVDQDTWCLDPDKIAAAISPRTKGIIAVHLYGHPADMDAIGSFAERHDLWVVEDAAEAHFATYRGRPIGGLATIGTFSFYGNKIITCGEGGAITFNDPSFERRARMLRSQGMDPERRYFHPIVGHNFRLSNLACALLCAQIERCDKLLATRRRIYEQYRRLLSKLPGIELQRARGDVVTSPWLFCALVDRGRFGCSRDALLKQLAADGIETRPFFVPLHKMPPYAPGLARIPGTLRNAERLAESGINLPTFSTMGEADVELVCALIKKTQESSTS